VPNINVGRASTDRQNPSAYLAMTVATVPARWGRAGRALYFASYTAPGSNAFSAIVFHSVAPGSYFR
jgi:hypothetical protein